MENHPTNSRESAMAQTPEIVHAKSQPAAVITLQATRKDLPRLIDPLIQELLRALAAQETPPAGPLFFHHLSRPTERFDLEVGFPVSSEVVSQGRMRASELPGGKAARLVHEGDYEGLPEAWARLQQWTETESGHTPQPHMWEVYTVGPETSENPADWRTELYWPVRDSS